MTRFLVVFVWLLVFVFISGTIFLLPPLMRSKVDIENLNPQEFSFSSTTISNERLIVRKAKDLSETLWKVGEYKWQLLLSKIIKLKPNGVSVDGLDLTLNSGNAKEQEIIGHISGNAKTRDALISLRKNLESEPYIKSVTLPISQLTQSINIPFNIEFITTNAYINQ